MSNIFSFYKTMRAPIKEKDIDLPNYIGMVQYGTFQDNVIKGREARQKFGKESDEYKDIKKRQPVITGSCVMKDGEDTNKKATNIEMMNGFIVIDIDVDLEDQTYNHLKNDKHTRLIHRSFGGEGACIFVPINQKKPFIDSFLGLAQYYLDVYGVTVDNACKNPNRLRYLSYDPDIYENPKAVTFNAKVQKKVKADTSNFIFHGADFDNILNQIKERHIDLCKEDYQRYVNIGMGIADEFKDSGLQYFDFICRFGGKYNERQTKKDYEGFVKNGRGEMKISTVYYYAKEFGLEVYSEKTKNIISRVQISKAQGKPTVESVAKNMKTVYGEDMTEEDNKLIQALIDSKVDYSKTANEDKSDIEQLEEFIINTWSPMRDAISKNIYLDNDVYDVLDDEKLNDMTIKCKKTFNGNFPVQDKDIRTIIFSNSTPSVDNVTKFFKENTHNEEGFIEQYARCVKPESDFNVWAFKKWLVGMVHNWTAEHREKIVSALTLVLTGQAHGIGKTSFFRNILPPMLEDYISEKKVDVKNKDHIWLMASSLMLIDQEFGGAIKDVKDFKSFSDENIIVMRRPFERTTKKFKRIAGLGGTSNEKNLIKDPTGDQRRILPINVESIAYDEMLGIDKAKMLVEAYNLLKEGFEWNIYKREDIQYLKDNTEENEDVMPMEEIFFSFFSLNQSKTHDCKVVLNQGDILHYMNVHSMVKPNKYDIKDIILKNRMTYKLHRLEGKGEPKKGFLLYVHRETADALYKSKGE